MFQKKIASLSPTLTDRVAEFNRREGDRKNLLASISALAEKVSSSSVTSSVPNSGAIH